MEAAVCIFIVKKLATQLFQEHAEAFKTSIYETKKYNFAYSCLNKIRLQLSNTFEWKFANTF